MVTTVIAVLALLLSLINLSLSLIGKDVTSSLGEFRSQEITDLKRKLAGHLLRLGALAATLLVSFPFVRTALSEPDLFNASWAAKLWGIVLLIGLATLAAVVVTCFRLASALRDPDVMSVRDSIGFFFAMIRGR